MKTTRRSTQNPVILSAILFLAAVLLSPAQTPADTWTGNSGSSANWSDAANWNPGSTNAPPQAYDAIFFDGTNQAVSTNDFIVGTVFNGITFNSNAAPFTLAGNDILLSGNVSGITTGVLNNSTNAQTVDLNLILDWGNHIFSSPGTNGTLSLNGAVVPNIGAVAFFSTNVYSTSLTNDASGLIASLGGAGLMLNNNGVFTNLATINGGHITNYFFPTKSRFGGGTLPSSIAGTNIVLTSSGSTTYSLANPTGTNYINNIVAINPNGGNAAASVVIGSVNSGTLVLGSVNGIGGIYLPFGFSVGGANQVQGLTIGGGPSLASIPITNYLTAGAMSGSPTPGMIVFGINGTNVNNQAEVNAVITDNGSGGAVTVVKTGIGSMFFAGTNTYSGGTYINQGYLQTSKAGGQGTGPVYIAANCEFWPNELTGTLPNDFYISPGIGPNYPLAFGSTGSSTLGAIKFDRNGGQYFLTGTIHLLGNPVTSAPGDRMGEMLANQVTLNGQITGTGTLELTNGDNSLSTEFFFLDNTNIANANNWTGGLMLEGGMWVQLLTSNQLAGNNIFMDQPGSPGNLLNFNLFSDAIGGLSGTVTGSEIINNGSGSTLTFGTGNATASYAGTVQGSFSIIKIGGGTQTFSGADTSTGNTTISAGTLALTGSGAISGSSNIVIAASATLDVSGRVDQTETINAGKVLSGNGTVNGNLTNNGVVSPGINGVIGQLTVTGNATLNGTTMMKLDAGNLVNDALAVGGNLVYGGTLNVANLSGTYTANKTFKLFSAATYSGAFTNIVPAVPALGLAWNTNSLTNGVLSIMAVPNPADTWTGNSGSSANWSDAANWNPGSTNAPPQAYDAIFFDGTNQAVSTNDFIVGTVFNGITFNSNAAPFTLAGNDILLSGNVSGITTGVLNNSTNAQTVDLNLILDWGNHIFSSPGTNGTLSLNGAVVPNIGAVAFFSTNVYSTSLTNDASGLIASLGGAGLMLNNNGVFTNLATINGGHITNYFFPTKSRFQGGMLGSTLPSSIAGTNIVLTAQSATYSLADPTGTNYINNIVAINPNGSLGSIVVIGSTNSGVLDLGSVNGIGGIYLPFALSQGGSGHTQGLTIGDGGSNYITAGPMSGSPTPGTIIFGINGTNNNNQAEVNGVITDNGSGGAVTVVKTGIGSMYINTNANTYSGGTYIDQGYLQVNNAAGLGTGPVYIAANCEIYLGTFNGGLWPNDFYISPGVGPAYPTLFGSSSTIEGAIRFGFPAGSPILTGSLHLLGSPVTSVPGDRMGGCANSSQSVQLTGQITGTGTLELMNAGASVNFTLNNVTNSPNNWTGGLIIDSNTTVNLGANNQLAGNNVIMDQPGDTGNLLNLNGFSDTIGGLSGTVAGSEIVSGGLSPALTLGTGNATASYAGTIQGKLSIIKTGSGTETFSGADTSTANTTISGGTLALTGSGAISASSNIIIAASATLDVSGRVDQTETVNASKILSGNGTVNGNLTNNGVVSPGINGVIGRLTVTGNATLNGTTMMKLNPFTHTNDVLSASGNIVYGGTLNVTNLTGIYPGITEFKLFNAATYSGAFTNIVPAIPAVNLAWDTHGLTNGVLGVMALATPPPSFGGFSLSGSSIGFNLTGGVPGWTFYLLATTNLGAPLNTWSIVQTNVFDAAGLASFTNPPSGAIQTYYILQLQ